MAGGDTIWIHARYDTRRREKMPATVPPAFIGRIYYGSEIIKMYWMCAEEREECWGDNDDK